MHVCVLRFIGGGSGSAGGLLIPPRHYSVFEHDSDSFGGQEPKGKYGSDHSGNEAQCMLVFVYKWWRVCDGKVQTHTRGYWDAVSRHYAETEVEATDSSSVSRTDSLTGKFTL